MANRFMKRLVWILALGVLIGCNSVLDNTPGELEVADATAPPVDASSPVIGADVADATVPPSMDVDASVLDASAPVDAAPLPPPDTGAAPTCTFGAKECNGACVQTLDPSYGCGLATCTPCALPHATPACSASGCAVGACDPGFADCDQKGANGCETDLSQTSHCGTCNTACPPAAPDCAPNAGSFACATGCGAGAPTLCGTQCVSLTTSLDNCGACGNVCPVVPNGQTSCNAGVCGFACHPDFHACGGVCASDVSPSTCGTSCAPCPTEANATATCSGVACGIVCNSGFANCDGSPTNGCEANLLTDPKNCGQCGASCSGRACSNGACAAPPDAGTDAGAPPPDAGPPPPDAGSPPPDAGVDASTGSDAAQATG
jgi:hypothetical protein